MGKNDPTIGLYGIWGVYNYGCEAIVRGTEIIIHELWPNAHIKYISPRPEDDKNRLEGCNVDIVPRKFHNLFSIPSLNGVIGQLTGFYSNKFYHEDLKWIEDCDMIFSIGGDIYTLPQKFNPKKKYYHPLIHFGEFVKSHGKTLVIWGASVGPFEDYPKAKKAFINHFTQIDLITSREPVTTKYLNDLGMINFTEYPDPAFKVPKGDHIKKKASGKLNIGINLSPLSSSYSFNSNMDAVIKIQAEIITELIKEFDAQITLIPHVVCDFNVNDDDLRYLKKIESNIKNDFSDQVKLIEDDVGFIGTKEVLSTCDIVISARMHCAINALSMGVPTIFLAYSKKAYGMVEYIYGNDKWVLNLNDIEKDTLLSLVNTMLHEKQELKILLEKNLKEIRSQSYNSLKEQIFMG